MAYNKFITHSGEVLLDLTADTATEADVLSGKRFHKADGSEGVGQIIVLDSNSVTAHLDFSEGDIKLEMPEGYLAQGAVIAKPDTLLPENIKEGISIAGIVGTHEGDGNDIVLADADITPDFSSGDQTVTPEEGSAFRTVILRKPATLTPDNIAAGVQIAGIVGAYEGGGDHDSTLLTDADITLDFSSGDQTVTPEEGAAFRSVILRKPTALTPENIAAGVQIAGVVGTYEGASVEDDRVKYVTFIGGDGGILYRQPVISGDTCRNPVTKGYISTPTKEDDVQYKDYTFTGWSLTSGGAAASSALSTITDNKTVYAAFNKTLQSYTVNFYDDDGTLLKTETVNYGSKPSAYYPPLKEYYGFAGWNPEISTVTGNVDYYATWVETENVAEGICGDNVTWAITNANELILSGTGSTYNYYSYYGGTKPYLTTRAPWYETYRDTITRIVINDGITRLGNGLFGSHTNVISVQIPDSVTELGDGTFAYNTSMEAFDLPESIETVGNATFLGCENLKSFTIPSKVTSVGVQFLINCYNLPSITIYAGLTRIGYRAFECRKLINGSYVSSFTSAIFEDTTSSWRLHEDRDSTATDASITGSQLKDPANAAKLLSDTHAYYYWTKR